AASIFNVLAGAADELASVRFFDSQNFANLKILVIERLAENVRGTFRGRELFKEHKNRELQSFAPLGAAARSGAPGHRFGKPRSNISFAAHARTLRGVDAQTRGCRGEVRGRIQNYAALGGLPPQPNVLDNIFRFGNASEHAISNSKKTRTYADKC